MFLYEDTNEDNIICLLISLSLFYDKPKIYLKNKNINNYLWINPNVSYYNNQDYKYLLNSNTICINPNIFKNYNDINEDKVDYKIKLLLNFMKNKKWTINLPIQPHPNGFYRHNNDSFRELCKLIKCVQIINTNSGHVWFDNKVLLYDRPKLEHMDKEGLNANMILLGNGSMNIEGNEIKKYNQNVKPFIFWARNPLLLEQNLNYIKYEDRKYNSIFIGNIENSTQEKYRNNINWKNVIDLYEITNGTKHKYTAKEYIELISQSKYGLCLRGYGSKCHREVELMAFGTVPLITDEVSTDYCFEFKENVHYFKVNSSEDIIKIINNTSKEKWQEMSNNCKNTYMKYCHSKNAIKSILSVIFEFEY